LGIDLIGIKIKELIMSGRSINQVNLSLLILTVSLVTSTSIIYANTYPYTSIEQINAVSPMTNSSLMLSSILRPASSKELFGVSSVTYIFRGAVADSINYLQFCTATDNTCTSCNVPFLTITAGTPIPYTIAGTTWKINSDAINAYLSAANFAAGTYNIGLYLQSAAVSCGGSYCSTNQDSSLDKLCIQAIYDPALPANTLVTRTDNGDAVLGNPKDLYAYVTDASAGFVYQCPVDTAGEISNICVSTAILNPSSITFGTSANGTINAYVPSISTSTVTRCIVTPATGNLGSCTPVTTPATFLSGATVAMISQGNNYLYLTDTSGAGAVYKCTLATDGTFTTGDCSSTGTPPNASWQSPTELIFGLTKVNSTTYPQYAYTTGSSGSPLGLITKCPYNPITGELGTCTETPLASLPVGLPTGMAINAAGTSWYAYAAIGSDGLTKCNYDITSGELTSGSCVSTPSVPPSGWHPYGVNFATINGTLFGYVASPTDHLVYKCPVDTSNGEFLVCNPTPTASAPWTGDPIYITFAYF
jgi:hypothetical protein